MGIEHLIKQHEDKLRLAPKQMPLGGPNDQWSDRRPIGVVYYSMGGADETEPGFRTPKNPNGWNPNFYGYSWAGNELDPSDPDFLSKFESRFKAFSEQSVARAVRENCQGIMVWDIEGSRWDRWATYVGDPIECLSPELPLKLVKWLVELASKNKLWTGFTLRHTFCPKMAHGLPQQIPAGLYANNVIWKMSLINLHLGPDVKATYLDSNVQVNMWVDGTPKSFKDTVMAEIQANRPGWLIVPEFYNTNYERVPRVFPCKWPNTPAAAYPQFVLPLASADEPSQQTKTDYFNAFKNGSIAAFTATWDAPWDKWMMEQYRAASSGNR